MMLTYSIQAKNVGAHLLHVRIDSPSEGEQLTAKLPKWIPGSYKIRDYSRFIQCFQVTDEHGNALNWHKTDSDTWVIDTAACQRAHLSYEVYAYDLSVRGAYLDDTRCFFNHCCVAFDIVEYSDAPRTIHIESVDDWRIFTALPRVAEGYIADNYAHQIDCPVESAAHYHLSEFTLNEVCHQVLFTGSISDDDNFEAITAHLKAICAAEMRLFEGTPLDKYLFMTYVEAKQYGGLEHKNSVAQMCAPDMLMKYGEALTPRQIDFLGLCSHEYFHLWNVKRLQPKDFQPYDLYREQHTEMLWFFEGITSYYDELFLLRAGVVDDATFLQRQADNLSRVLAVPGRLLQPLAASSFDAWTKLYQADNNSANHMVSYYSKGAVFALCLDLFIRQHSQGAYSADDMLRDLWRRFGEKGRGIDEDDVLNACAKLLPVDAHPALAVLFVNGLHGTADLPLASLVREFGVDYQLSAPKTNQRLHTSDSGLRLDPSSHKIVFLDARSHAASVGVSVDDCLLAIDGEDSQRGDFAARLNFARPEQELKLTLSRRGRVFEKRICLAEPQKTCVSLRKTTDNPLGKAWLARWIDG